MSGAATELQAYLSPSIKDTIEAVLSFTSKDVSCTEATRSNVQRARAAKTALKIHLTNWFVFKRKDDDDSKDVEPGIRRAMGKVRQ
jgi:hypothetical protein